MTSNWSRSILARAHRGQAMYNHIIAVKIINADELTCNNYQCY